MAASAKTLLALAAMLTAMLAAVSGRGHGALGEERFASAIGLYTIFFFHCIEKICIPFDRPHVCDVCAKAFKKPYDLKRHKLVHSGEALPHTCDVCSKAFTKPENLKRHKLIHSGEKPYECEVCHKRFTQSGSLKMHVQLHSNETPYTCGVCGQAFNFKGYKKLYKLILR